MTCDNCGKPYFRPPSVQRHGKLHFCSRACLLAFTTKPEHVAERFWRYVEKTDSCWLWTGAVDETGYGRFRTGGKRSRFVHASRFSWELANGPIPNGLQPNHNCPGGDNPLCVNPAHLWLGNQQANVRDCWAKGRHVAQRGEDSPVSKLTAETVTAIRAARAAGVSGVELSRQYGISEQNICSLVKRRSWRHVP